MQITRNTYLDALRHVTKLKVQAVAEGKQLFEQRVLRLMKAQYIEVNNQEHIGLEVARKAFTSMASGVLRQLLH